MKETKFSHDFIDKLIKEYPLMWYEKISGSVTQATGIPDYIFCINGKFIAIEFKIQRDNKIKIKPRQIKQINKMLDSKGVALIIAYDENRNHILIRQKRLDPKVAMVPGNRINIDWNYNFNDFDSTIRFMKSIVRHIRDVSDLLG